MNIIQQIHESIEHDHRESCNLEELIDKVLEAEAYIKADDALQEMFGQNVTLPE